MNVTGGRTQSRPIEKRSDKGGRGITPSKEKVEKSPRHRWKMKGPAIGKTQRKKKHNEQKKSSVNFILTLKGGCVGKVI